MEVKLYTSNFARYGTDPRAVSIAIGNPRWFKGKRYLDLAPTRKMLAMWIEDYDRHFAAILEWLDPMKVVKDLNGSILLCWESPNVRCHRRFVAEWIESETGIVVPEMDVEEVMAYQDMPLKGQKAKKKADKQPSLSFT